LGLTRAFVPPNHRRVFACGVGRELQIWESPPLESKQFQPFKLVGAFGTCHDDITCLDWSPCGEFVAAGSRDLACHIFSGRQRAGYRAPALTGHRAPLVGCFFARRGEAATLYTVSEDGALVYWEHTPDAAGASLGGAGAGGGGEGATASGGAGQEGAGQVAGDPKPPAGSPDLGQGGWRAADRKYFQKNEAQVTACAFHPGLNLLAAGFSTGVFELYQLPDFTSLQALSVSQAPVSTLSFGAGGEWLHVGCGELGQLAVWEWRSESFVFRQQGHTGEVAGMDVSRDGALLVTGARDAKVKVWSARTGQCVVTFSDHRLPVMAVAFAPSGNAVLSAGSDGTVQAFDLVRHRRFRTLTPPEPSQLCCLAVDTGGEIVAAGSADTFQVFLWSLRTGKLLDTLSGHEAPVSGLHFSPLGDALASCSWDRSVRLWDTFTGQGRTEALPHSSEVLALAFHPGGKSLCSATLRGNLIFWDAINCSCLGVVDGARDIRGGRLTTDRRLPEHSAEGKHFTSVCYSPDGALLLAGGESKWVCLYDARERTLLARVQISHNVALDGVRDLLSSRDMTEAGPLSEIVDDDGKGARARRRAAGLPGTGAARRAVARTRAVRWAATGASWALATPEGVVVYSKGDGALFDPTDLGEDATPEAAYRCHREGQHLKALLIALRLGDPLITVRVLEGVPPEDVAVVAGQVPAARLGRLLGAIASRLEKGPHLEFYLDWLRPLYRAHSGFLSEGRADLEQPLRRLQKAVAQAHGDLKETMQANRYQAEFLCRALACQGKGSSR